jgi:hypothetical protein
MVGAQICYDSLPRRDGGLLDQIAAREAGGTHALYDTILPVLTESSSACISTSFPCSS